MARNKVQCQKGLSEAGFEAVYGTEEQCSGTLSGLLDHWASATPSSPAVLCEQGATSFASLADESRRVAYALAGLGIESGDTVGIWMPNCRAWMAIFVASARLGARVAAINTRFRPEEVQDVLARSKARVLFSWPSLMGQDLGGAFESMDRATLEHLRAVVLPGETGEYNLPGSVSVHGYGTLLATQTVKRPRPDPDSGAVLFTTSGSTGRPKLVLHSQRGLSVHAADVARAVGLDRPDAVALQPMPLCGAFGLCQALSALAAGRPMVIQDRWDIEHMAHLIVKHRVTNFAGTDELIMRLLATSKMERPFPSVRWSGYATFSTGLGHWFEAAEARGLRPVGLYGASEVQALFAVQDPSAPIAVRCRDGGFPVSARARVRVRDNETGRLLPVGELGELEMTGQGRMACYEGDAAATEQAVTLDGFVHVSDYGRILENGSFLFAGRSGDWLRLSGFLVAPAEIEAVIEGVPGIQGCQIVGADWKGAQRPFAFVTLQSGARLDAQAIGAACDARLARYKVPVRVEVVDSFPVADGPNGVKILKPVLRGMAADLLKEQEAQGT